MTRGSYVSLVTVCSSLNTSTSEIPADLEHDTMLGMAVPISIVHARAASSLPEITSPCYYKDNNSISGDNSSNVSEYIDVAMLTLKHRVLYVGCGHTHSCDHTPV